MFWGNQGKRHWTNTDLSGGGQWSWGKVVSDSGCTVREAFFLCQRLPGQLVSTPLWKETENYIGAGRGGDDIQAIWNSLFFPTTPSGLESKYRMATVLILEQKKKKPNPKPKNPGRQWHGWGRSHSVTKSTIFILVVWCNIVPNTKGTSDIHLVPERPRIEVNSYKSQNVCPYKLLQDFLKNLQFQIKYKDFLSSRQDPDSS